MASSVPEPNSSRPGRHRKGAGARPVRPWKSRKNPAMIYNPVTGESARKDAGKTRITVFQYRNGSCEEKVFGKVADVYHFRDEDAVTWINIDGIRRKDVRDICNHFHVHMLTIDDILSIGQRAKMDEMNDMIFALLPMLYFNSQDSIIEREQISILLMKNVVLSFQDDLTRDPFEGVRDKLHSEQSRLRAAGSDALYSALLDAIVDQYFVVMESLGEKMEDVEELIIRAPDNETPVRINHYRMEVGALRRAISPVGDLLNGILKTDNSLIQKRTKSYFKDTHDHILQANETMENYRELIVILQDLYLNQVNLRMNVIMKVLALVTALFAPLYLITGIYGMNFINMPALHTRFGYFVTLGVMFVLFAGMLIFFRKRGWF